MIKYVESKKVKCESQAKKGVIRGFLTNLGKYNEGELVGRWVDFPMTEKDFNKALKEIGINQRYEEFFWTDWETDIDGFDVAAYFGEYASYEDVNALVEALDKLDDEGTQMLATLNSFYSDVECNLANIINENVWCYSDVDSWDDLADREIEAGGGVESLGKDLMEQYFDFKSFGRDVELEFSAGDVWDEDELHEIEEQGIEPNAGYYWCGDDGASDSEIGEAIVADLGIDGVNHPENYFDFKQFGHDMSFDGTWVIDSVAVFVLDYDSSLKLKDVM